MIELVGCAEEHRWMLLEWRNSDGVAPYMYDNALISREAHDEWYSALLEDSDRYGWVIAMDATPVGACFLNDHNVEHRRASFGLYLADPSTRGRGVGTAAQVLLCDKAFGELGVHKLCCEALGSNRSAIAMYKKLGFAEEGILVDHLLRDDTWVDVHLLALFEQDWQRHREDLKQDLRKRGLIS